MFRLNNTDSEWQKWGEYDPYFAVLTSPKFRGRKNKDHFFASGEQYFVKLLSEFDRLCIPLNKEGVALDYGCGVGRILKPISNYFYKSIGVDVSQAMLEEARSHVDAGKTQLRLFDGKDLSCCLSDGKFHFVNSYLVFQHIRTKRGFYLLGQLLERLEKNGRALIQAPMTADNKIKYFFDQIVTSHPALLKLSRTILRKESTRNDPVMQMNIYPADALIKLFCEHGVEVRHISLGVDSKNALTYASWYLYKP